MSTEGMPQSPNPPTDSVIPSVIPAMASAGVETTLSMARTLVTPRGSPLRSDTSRDPDWPPRAVDRQAPTHTRYACGRGTSDEFGLEQRLRETMDRYAHRRRRPRRRRPPCRLCRRHEEPVPPPLLASRSPAAAEAQREAGREAQRRTPAAIAGTRTRGDRAAASATYRAQRPHRGPRHRHPLGGVPRLGAVQRLEQRHPGGQQPVRRPPGRQRAATTTCSSGRTAATGSPPEQQQALGGGGYAEGKRTDSIILVHVPGKRRQAGDDLDPPRLLRPDPRPRQQQDQRGLSRSAAPSC